MQGSLASVWLGGMSNPGAMFLALCQEKAVLHDVSIDDVHIQCCVPSENDDVMEQEAGIFVEDLFVVNAKINKNKGLLLPSAGFEPAPFPVSVLEVEFGEGSVAIPVLYFYPSLATEEVKTGNAVRYPVYMNMVGGAL